MKAKAKAKAMPCAKCGGSYKKGGVTRKKPLKRFQGTEGSSTVKSVDPNLAALSQAASTAAAIPASTNSAAANAAMVNTSPVPMTPEEYNNAILAAKQSNKLKRVQSRGTADKADTTGRKLANIGAILGLVSGGLGAFSGIKDAIKKDKAGGSTQYRRGGKTTNKPARVSPKSAPQSASKKAAVFKKGGTKKK